MVVRNKNLAKLKSGYLFPEINRRKTELLKNNPEAKIISLGVGNTTEPLSTSITKGLVDAAFAMGTKAGYLGYGDEQGFTELRRAIADKLYNGLVDADEVFISDGAKCDIGRLQLMFGSSATVSVQDPSYPVYVDGSVIIGATGEFDDVKLQFRGITYLKCTPENDFFPKLESSTDLIYFCSPNNPTGACASKTQLEELVAYAKKNSSFIIFDSAYSEYVSDKNIPKSIYEIEGARDVAIEVSSFSKPIGFTGLRLGWSIVPKQMKYADGKAVIDDWNRITSTVFNGASNVVQSAGLAALTDFGLSEMRETIAYYMENASIIKKTLDENGVKTYGGVNAPYIWAHFPGKKSWDVFSQILESVHVVTTPGSGFGSAGEGFVRFSAFGHREDINEAVKRLETILGEI